MWDEVEKTKEKFVRHNSEGKEEAVTRTKTETYDPAGRALTSEEKAEPATDTALPKVTNKYNEETGALETQSETIGGKEKTITSKNNTLGQLIEYTDAEGNVAKYVYEEGGDERLEEEHFNLDVLLQRDDGPHGKAGRHCGWYDRGRRHVHGEL